MMLSSLVMEPIILVAGVILVLACACGLVALMLDVPLPSRRPQRRRSALIEQERDLAAALGWKWPHWILLRVAVVAAAAALGIWSGIWTVAALSILIAVLGLRFAVAGAAARRRVNMERAFLGELRTLRDRMAVSNQSLDTALQEMGRTPSRELTHVLAPLGHAKSISEGIVECAERARSPLVEHACAVLLWSRTRSLTALIDAIDDVLLPVGEAQLAVQEESLVTLTQQRAVTFAMGALLAFMFFSVLRVDAFRAYYQSAGGTVVLLTALTLFFLLVALLGRIARVSP